VTFTDLIDLAAEDLGGAVLLAITFLPATLAILGRSLDLPKWLAKRLAWYHAPSAWERWAR